MTPSKNNPKIDYDTKYDILYVIFGDNSHSYEDDDMLGFGIIRDMFSDDVVGITCYGFIGKKRSADLHNMLLSMNIVLQK